MIRWLLTCTILILSQMTNGLFSPIRDFVFDRRGNSVEVSFTAFNEEFKYLTNLDEHAVAQQMKAVVHNGNYTYLQPHEVKGYSSQSNNHYASFVITADNQLHGLVIRNGEHYEIAPKYHYLNHPQYTSTLEQIDADTVIFKHSSIDWSGIKCGTSDHIHNIKRPQMAIESGLISPTNGNNPPLNGPYPSLWTPCYLGSNILHKEFIGIAVDYGAYKLMGSSVSNVQSYLTSLLMNINYVYANQVHLYLTLVALTIQTTPGKFAWNQDSSTGSCQDISTTLSAFTAWRKIAGTVPTLQVSTWHLLSGCWQPPGVVGLAWIGTLCDNQYSAGVSSLFPGNWVTVAHELGHNHGANHTWPANQPSLAGHVGGIMDYGDGTYQGIYQFHPIKCKSLVCNEVQAAMSGKCLSGCQPITKCFQSTVAVCGNGRIEPPESCDDGALTGTESSCCAINCQPKPGIQCLSGECCNAACQFERTNKICQSNGYCGPGGACTRSTCAIYGFPYCGINPSTNCTMLCMVNGQCSNMNGWSDASTGQPLNMKVLDSSICVKGSATGMCLNGVCI
jgi:hypothetical protein